MMNDSVSLSRTATAAIFSYHGKISEETPFYGADGWCAKFVREHDAGWL